MHTKAIAPIKHPAFTKFIVFFMFTGSLSLSGITNIALYASASFSVTFVNDEP